jgi:hypothetical protein
MMMRKPFVAVFVLLLSTPAFAEPAAPAPDVESAPAAVAPPPQHEHAGVFLRAELGAGFRSMSTSDAGSMKFSGAGAGFAFAVGGPVADNLILLGELTVDSMQNPTLQMGSRSFETTDASSTLLGIGPGVTYYFMPANVHVGATVLLTEATLTYKGEKIAETELGFGGLLRVGKDFWIGKSFGLGVAGQFTFATMKDKVSDGGLKPTWSALAGTLALEGTYN